MIKLLSGNISESSLEIYGLDVEQGVESDNEGYNLGDLLNMPYFFANWNNTPHMSNSMYNIFKKTAIQYKDNILGIYNNTFVFQNQLSLVTI